MKSSQRLKADYDDECFYVRGNAVAVGLLRSKRGSFEGLKLLGQIEYRCTFLAHKNRFYVHTGSNHSPNDRWCLLVSLTQTVRSGHTLPRQVILSEYYPLSLRNSKINTYNTSGTSACARLILLDWAKGAHIEAPRVARAPSELYGRRSFQKRISR